MALIHTSRKIAVKKNCYCVSHHEIHDFWGNKPCSGEERRSFSEQNLSTKTSVSWEYDLPPTMFHTWTTKSTTHWAETKDIHNWSLLRMFAIKIIDETSWGARAKQWQEFAQDFYFPICWKMVFLPWPEIRHHPLSIAWWKTQWQDFLRQFFLMCG